MQDLSLQNKWGHELFERRIYLIVVVAIIFFHRKGKDATLRKVVLYSLRPLAF